MTSHERKVIRYFDKSGIHGVRSGASKWACDVVLSKGNAFAIVENKATEKSSYRISKDQHEKMLSYAKEGTPSFYIIYFKNQNPRWGVYPVLETPSNRKLDISNAKPMTIIESVLSNALQKQPA